MSRSASKPRAAAAAFELHALLPVEAALPSASMLPREARLKLVTGRRIGAVISAGGREADSLPWHREVCAALSRHGPCLPLPCSLRFGKMAEIHAWMAQRETTFADALDELSGHEEWIVTLAEDAQAHGAWLAARDPGLARLQSRQQAERERNIAKIAAAQEAARQARRGMVSARVEHALAVLSRAGAREPVSQNGHQRWSVLVPVEAVNALRLALAREAHDLAGTGLLLDVSEHQPAFRFARAVTHDA